MVGRTDRQSWGLFGACRYPKHESKGRNRDRQAEFGRKQCLMVPAGVFPSEPGMTEKFFDILERKNRKFGIFAKASF